MKGAEGRKNFFKKISELAEDPLLTSTIVLVLVTIIVLAASYPYYVKDFEDFLGQVLAEAHGMIFDILIIGILLYWLNKTGEKRQRIRMYKDEIDDFRLWESDEAAFRTVGNIKRLNRHKIYSLNLVNCYLSKTNLNYVTLKGANLNYANVSNSNLLDVNLQEARLNQTRFENCNMNHASFKGAYANGAIFRDAYLIKTDFQRAFLIKADFSNAFLMESDLRNAYLTNADFFNANLYKADFRGAKGIQIEQLSKAKTLYLAKFDDELQELVRENLPDLAGG
jgi:BTB/POZ domain-containing protein KCTD9